MTNPTGSILLRRGPTADRVAFTPIEGEIIYDTLLKKIFIGDGATPGGRTVTSDIIIGGSGQILNIPNTSLENSTISGIALGQNLRTLTFGTGLSGISYNGSTAVTVAIDATSSNVLNSVVARDTNGDFAARRITADLIGNAATVTNGVVTSASYSNPSWIVSLNETKVLPSQGLTNAGKVLTTNGSFTSWANLIPVSPAANQMAVYGRWLNTNGTTLQWTDVYPSQSGNSGKFLSTNGSFVGWAGASAVGLPSIVGNDNKYLKVSGTDVVWGDIAGGDSANTINKLVLRDASGNFSAGTITANLIGNVTGNADTVTNGVYTSSSYSNPSWIASLSLTQGGTGANNRVDAFTNLLPTGEQLGYVLTTTSRGTYFWGPGGGGGSGGNVGNVISTSRNTFTATEGQQLFTGVGNYVPGAGQLRIFIDGVRQFPSEYVETSATSFTLTVGLPAGVKVFAEIDAYTGVAIPASSITFAPIGNLTATNVQLALTEVDLEKAPITSPTFTGTVGGITATMVGLGNVTNESKATMFSSPTFTGTVSGVTNSHVGLGNVDNTSDANKPVSFATQTALNLKAPLASPTFTGTVSGVTKAHVGLGNVDNTTDANKQVSTAAQAALDLKAPLASPTFSGAMAFANSSTVNFTNAAVSGLSVSAFPSGTRLVFAQTAAPTGWTKDTTHDNAALRVVSGTAGSGGTQNFTTAFTTQGVSGSVGGQVASGTIGSQSVSGSIANTTAGGGVGFVGSVGATTLTESQMPSHSHAPNLNNHQFVTNDYPAGQASWTFVSQQGNMQANGGYFTATSGGSTSHTHTFGHLTAFYGDPHNHTFNGSSHDHTFTGSSHSHSFSGTSIDLTVKYVDTIIATKD